MESAFNNNLIIVFVFFLVNVLSYSEIKLTELKMCWIQNKKDKFILIAESIEKEVSFLISLVR